MNENNGLSDTDKLNKEETDSELNSLYDAINSGKQEDIDRLMAADIPDTEESGEPETKPSEAEPAEPAPTPNDDVAPKNDKEPEPKGSAPQEAAPTAASPDDAVDEVATLKAQIEELRQQAHKYQSDAGRVPHLQRRLSELERQARAPARTATKASPEGKLTFTAEDYKNVELDPDTQKEIDELKVVDPVMGNAVERSTKTAILTAQRRMEQVLAEREQVDQEFENERFYLEQKAELTREVPQHEEIFRSKEWAEWKNTLTPGERALAESGYASDVKKAIYSFAAVMRERYPQAVAAAPEKNEPVNTGETPPESQPTEVALARARRTAEAPAVKNPSAKPTETFDEDAYFKEMYNEEGKKHHILK